MSCDSLQISIYARTVLDTARPGIRARLDSHGQWMPERTYRVDVTSSNKVPDPLVLKIARTTSIISPTRKAEENNMPRAAATEALHNDYHALG